MNKELIQNKLSNIFKNQKKLAFMLFFLILIIYLLITYISTKESVYFKSINAITQELSISKEEQSKECLENIKIHISGEVKNPGIYELSKGSRIADAIEIASGITINADLKNINLAYELSDGQKIIIPNKNEELSNEFIQEACYDNSIETEKNQDLKININTASKEELSSLSGIGISTAEKIISYRQEHGKFKTIEDIKNVNGIGENKFNKIKDFIKTK